MNYIDAREYINDATKRGIVPGLENITLLCEALGNPQKKVKTIHIAGTNGKGSVGSFITSALIAAGYNVARYVSPAVFEYREILSINGEMISEEDFAECVSKVKAAEASLPEKNMPTSFEIETAAAFVYFDVKNCDYAVVECGMGGRGDATNVTDKVLSVITSISFDHSAFLGDTVEKIAEEKAGIIKGAAVSANQIESVKEVIKGVCPSAVFADYEKIENVNYTLDKTVFDYKDIKNIEIKLLGKQQLENAATAIEAAEMLGLDEKSIKLGLKNAVWHGRFEVVSDNPIIIADGAHNYDAALRLKENAEIYLKDKPLYFVMGMFKDKEYKRVAEVMTPLATEVFTISPKGERGLDSRILADYITTLGTKATACDNLSKALEFAKEKGGAVLVFGSLSFLGELYTEVHNGKI